VPSGCSRWSVSIQFFDLTGGCDCHVCDLALALKLGTGDRPVIYQPRDRCSSWRTTLARPIGDVTRRAGTVAACALCRARFSAPVGAGSGRALAPPVSLCLAAAAIRLLLRA
jgi:hypothetical protein